MIAVPAGAIAGTSSDNDVQPVVYAVRINGVAMPDVNVFLVDPQGKLFVDMDALDKWRVKKPDGADKERRAYSGLQFIPLDSIAGATAKIDSAHQMVDLGVPASDFTENVLTEQVSSSQAAVHGHAAYANYSANYLSESGVHSGTAQLTGGFSTNAGFFQSGLLYEAGQQLHSVALTGASWEHDDPAAHTHLIFGNTSTSTDFFSRSVLATGVQFATDFATDPGFLTFPLPTINGSTAVPSIVDVYVNNLNTAHRQVNPGSFVLSNVPMIDGEDNVTLIVTDANGQQRVVKTKFYFARGVLKKHLSQHTVTAGFQTTGFGQSTFSYGPFVLDASERYGFSDSFTGGADVQHSAGITTLDLTGDTIVGSTGQLSVNVAGSNALSGSGTALRVGFDHQARRLTYGVLAQANSAHFSTPGTLVQNAIASTGASVVTNTNVIGSAGGSVEQFHASYRTTPEVSVSTAFTGTNIGGFVQKYVTLGMSRYTRHAQIDVSAYRQIGNGGFGFTFAITRQMPDGRQVQVQGGTPSLGQNGFSVQRQMPDSGIGTYVDARVAPTGDADLYLYDQTTIGSWSLDTQRWDGQLAQTANVNGGLIFDGHHVLPTETVSSAYGVATFPGHPHVPVYVNERLAGYTNAQGEVALPMLAPFYPNSVRLDLTSQPLAVDAKEESKVVVPYRDNGVRVAFVPTDGGGATMTVVSSDGKAYPRGAVLKVGNDSFPMGYDGKAYIGPIHPGTIHVEGNANGTKCQFDVDVPEAVDSIPDLGTVVCKP